MWLGTIYRKVQSHGNGRTPFGHQKGTCVQHSQKSVNYGPKWSFLEADFAVIFLT